MTRERLLALSAVALLVAIAVVAWPSKQATPSSPATPAPVAEVPAATEAPTFASAPRVEATPAPTPRSSRTSGSPLAAELNASGFDAQHDVATLHAMLRQYLRSLHGRQGHPIGNDSDLARALTGHNPMKLVVLPPTHPALTADGRLHDRWGTPYFIHPRGRLAFEIRSAGPDRRLFTPDDLIENPGGRATDLSTGSLPGEPSDP